MKQGALQYTMKTETSAVDIDRSIGDFSYPEDHMHDAGVGLNEDDDPLHLRRQRRSGLGPRISAQGLKTFLGKTDADALGEQGSRSDRFR